jgi:micrococcal nuclease
VKVVRVVDGDTVDLAMELIPGQYFQLRVRLYGIDTPEKRPLKTAPNRDEEIAAAKRSTEALDGQLRRSNYIIDRAEFREADKYGRWLCDLFVRNNENDYTHLNEWMIREGYAKPYFGGTKEKFVVCEEENV